jgi:hypothetical protein
LSPTQFIPLSSSLSLAHALARICTYEKCDGRGVSICVHLAVQGKILPVVLQLLFHKGRLALHGKKIENYIQSDFE